jgi:hypothetical protein
MVFGFTVLILHPTLNSPPQTETILYITDPALISVPLILIAILGIFIGMDSAVLKLRRSGMGCMAFILTALYILGGIVVLPGPASRFPYEKTGLHHTDRVRLNGNIYNLAQFWEGFRLNYVVYKCDSLSIRCKAVYKYLIPEGHEIGSLLVLLDENQSMPRRLVVDDNANTVSLEIDGEVVYTHQVEG